MSTTVEKLVKYVACFARKPAPILRNLQSYLGKTSIWVNPQLHIIWMLAVFCVEFGRPPRFHRGFPPGAPLSSHRPEMCHSLNNLNPASQ